MNVTNEFIFVITAMLSLAPGAAKVTAIPQEKIFFEATGLRVPVLIAFGIAQISAGVAIAVKPARAYGSVAAAVDFFASALMNLNCRKSWLCGVLDAPGPIGDLCRSHPEKNCPSTNLMSWRIFRPK